MGFTYRSRKIHRRIVLGTADELRSIASARKMVVGLRREININDVRIRRESIKLADLSRHFQQRELGDGNPRISYSTKKAYGGYLEKWIDPRWGEYRLLDVRAVEVESWLKSLALELEARCLTATAVKLGCHPGPAGTTQFRSDWSAYGSIIRAMASLCGMASKNLEMYRTFAL
jgi:hypothetical protein